VPKDIPNTRLINFVDTPAGLTYSQFGDAQVVLDPNTGGILDVDAFRRVSLLIGSTQAPSFSLFIGKLAGATLGFEHNRPVDQRIHTFQIVGPEIALVLRGGAPNSSEQVQLWVYLSS
jgi:hypothetical protein